MPIDISKIKAIDVHVHAEVSCHDPEDVVMGKFFDAASAYFKAPRERPKMPEIVEIYREQQIACPQSSTPAIRAWAPACAVAAGCGSSMVSRC